MTEVTLQIPSAGQVISHTNQSTARRAEEERTPAVHFSSAFPDSKFSHRKSLQAHSSLRDSVEFSLPPPCSSNLGEAPR